MKRGFVLFFVVAVVVVIIGLLSVALSAQQTCSLSMSRNRGKQVANVVTYASMVETIYTKPVFIVSDNCMVKLFQENSGHEIKLKIIRNAKDGLMFIPYKGLVLGGYLLFVGKQQYIIRVDK